MRRLFRTVAITILLWMLVVAGLIVFGTASPPPALPSVTGPFSSMELGGQPPLRSFRARNGAQLHFREYAADGSRAAVLIHGSAGSSGDMHMLALALQRAGITSYVPDLRGHGADTPHGDIQYVHQLDDDLSDFMDELKAARHNATWTLIGFSSGGGFALRIAAEGQLGQLFDRYILLSPYLRYDSPSVRQSDSDKKPDGVALPVTSQSWAAPSIGRIIGLNILNSLGIRAWDGLSVLAFPVPADVESVTQHYSWRLLRNFGADDDYAADIRAVTRPMQVYVGELDEILIPSSLQTEFQSQRRDIPVAILQGIGHSGMITRQEAISAVVAHVQQQR